MNFSSYLKNHMLFASENWPYLRWYWTWYIFLSKWTISGKLDYACNFLFVHSHEESTCHDWWHLSGVYCLDCRSITNAGSNLSVHNAVTANGSDEFSLPFSFAEYDAENPRILTKCEHHFHLSCILEWMERSDTCPVCDQVCPAKNLQ